MTGAQAQTQMGQLVVGVDGSDRSMVGEQHERGEAALQSPNESFHVRAAALHDTAAEMLGSAARAFETSEEDIGDSDEARRRLLGIEEA